MYRLIYNYSDELDNKRNCFGATNCFSSYKETTKGDLAIPEEKLHDF